jgi:hypothetical protein
MKTKIIKLTPKYLTDALHGKATSYASNLPSDTELLDVKYDLFSNQILAVVRSESFPDQPENHPPPELKLTYTPTPQNQAQPTPNPPTTSTPKPKPPQTNPRLAISSVEEEFSPEQQRLLSFKTEGEQTIVKPTQFLKEEWEDINETVKSLGGKWVKGDIISYWVIPPQ